MAWLVLAACSSATPPNEPESSCTFFRTTIEVAGPADAAVGNPVGDPDASVDCPPRTACSFDCWPPAGLGGEAGAPSCMVLVTVPGAPDESTCRMFGYQIPAPDVLHAVEAQGDASSPAAVCVLPQLDPARLDAGGGCLHSIQPGWCIATGPELAYTGCNQLFLLSESSLRADLLYTLACSQCR